MGKVAVIGAGLAGSEAAFKIATSGFKVDLYEMRPVKTTPAHRTEGFAELVCSNSLGGKDITTGSGLLKEEMRLLGSLIVSVAEEFSVPAGGALAVDRVKFSRRITEILENHPNIKVIRKEVTQLPEGYNFIIIATGPLTSEAFSKVIQRLTGSEYLYFYDAIAPTVDADTVDFSKGFWGDRYGKGKGDYFNCVLNEEEYEIFYNELINGKQVPLKDFEKAVFFEGCLPIEEMARRGKQTLLFGPMKPVGLIDPKTGKQPFAVIQLRKENREGTLLSLVGFQTKLKYPEQKRIFRLIPALKDATFVRLGSIHRNTFIQSHRVLKPTLQLKKDPRILFAGQITGVEGYAASAATGILAGINVVRMLKGKEPTVPPETTMLGGLVRYITEPKEELQPMNPNFSLLPDLDKKVRDKRRRKLLKAERALKDMEIFASQWKN
ncbi:MAG TPA: FADH(2)-oxidizing methylenetetrahydrofolate--tRNA-(uracil(54)-C(5))-methyltransferase TrmFO [Persephonella sp.]|uniref:Methylenetetrahydrofolate--tRNA-(uracil-5-)-methyltransferase TrmFO n=1 Tax=Persephonella marina (strain DSM 14350 / EX-H1) TaxID=123214 RepID=TRMFO_PERMH|nr:MULTISPECIES: FADH(2)-oxidizing methylenetetrahydrofolate--tRNA-(uracil(54)-C(5))-methyltransferase TrmFO [Persephonella]C0QTE2.1 RecName: Full=Methylenetetrahydrofolate--tRNA-(uracil-5-)-methyltransferase TrmFO; AltName: Full=Folate-dependent tRNA (uracil-5-)-methyltransferase; AltName: Full=Folate-dependent tRNA(M-5-U54)-methyltransferase [Persephonella marina EX-H1]ACO03475.1 tRNA:M(5)U-54 methyltransferase [Persephonella marina EX-H1]HCB70424.1 FADH(2)-oxidizing methylenetetrahydrofolate-